jgi:hypothetical protein
LQVLADLWWNIIRKNITGPEALCNVHALLPALELSSVQKLEAPEPFEIFVFVVVVVKVDLGHFVETPGEQAPNALPFLVSGLSTGPPEARPCSNVEATSGPGIGSASGLRPRARVALNLEVVQVEAVGAFHAIPVAFWDFI